jgi:hypothetical protein
VEMSFMRRLNDGDKKETGSDAKESSHVPIIGLEGGHMIFFRLSGIRL